MSQTGPWSVKGIDARAREAARERARQEGMTLGEYLNSLILKGGEVGAQDIVAPISAPKPKPQAAASSLNKLVSRIEAAEARSTLAITGIDQSVVGLLKRIEDTETEHIAMARHVDGVIDDIRSTYEALREKVRRIEEDDSAEQNIEALKALENALGKLASHVYEENALAQTESDAIKGRVEAGFADLNDRVEKIDTKVEETLTDAARRVERAVEQAELRAEGTARHLSERMSTLDTKIGRQERNNEQLTEKLQDTETRINLAETAIEDAGTRVDAIEGDVTTALESMEATLLRVQDRLNRAETTTDAALKSLESTFDVLDERINEVAKAAPEHAFALRQQFEERFDGLADELRASVAATRAELAAEIENAAMAGIAPEQLETFENKLSDVQRQLAENDQQHAAAIENVGDQVSRITESFEKRIEAVEAQDHSSKVAAEFGKLADVVQGRLEQLEDREATVIERVGDEMTKIADQLDQRIEESEQRSASAIEQVGEQVSRVTNKLQTRQEEAFEAFAKKIDENASRADARLSDALTNVSQRLELMQTQSASTLSPVQKAIASLATRLDSLEEFAAPPFAEAPRAAALPKMQPLPINDPLFTKEDAPEIPEPVSQNEATPDTVENKTDVAFGGVASTISVDLYEDDDAPANEGDNKDEFEPGIESWDDLPSEHEAKSSAPEYSAEVPKANPLDDDGDPIAALEEAWDDGASEARDTDVFDDVFEVTAALEADVQPEEIAEPASSDDFLKSARAAALNAAEVGTKGPNAPRTRTKEKKPKSKRSRGGTDNTGNSGGGSSKLPLIATASVVALATAGGTAYYAMKDGETVDLQKIATPQPAPTPAAPIETAQLEPSTAVAAATIEVQGGADELFETAAPAATETAPQPVVAKPAEAPAEKAPAPTPEPKPVRAETKPPAQPAPEKPTPEKTVAAAPAPTPRAAIAKIEMPRTIETAARSGDPKALFTLAKSKIDTGSYSEGAGMMRRAADAGEPAAQYRMGKLHEKGLGVPRDLALARKWTETAANGGNVRAMHDLAVFYAQGDGGPQSYAAAVTWFRKAAEYGVVDSQYNLGVLYERGIGIDPDPSEALFWYVIAARGGDAQSATRIRELNTSLPVDTATATTDRAKNWKPKEPSGPANGFFSQDQWGTIGKTHIAGVQKALTALGYDAGSPDGTIGPSTAAAIRDFERKHGLPSTGKVTTRLIEKINEQATS